MDTQQQRKKVKDNLKLKDKTAGVAKKVRKAKKVKTVPLASAEAATRSALEDIDAAVMSDDKEDDALEVVEEQPAIEDFGDLGVTRQLFGLPPLKSQASSLETPTSCSFKTTLRTKEALLGVDNDNLA